MFQNFTCIYSTKIPVSEVWHFQHTTIAQHTGPQLHADYAEDEEDEEAQQQHVAQHGQRVQKQVDQDAHTRHPVDGSQRPQHPYGPNGGQVHRTAQVTVQHVF